MKIFLLQARVVEALKTSGERSKMKAEFVGCHRLLLGGENTQRHPTTAGLSVPPTTEPPPPPSRWAGVARRDVPAQGDHRVTGVGRSERGSHVRRRAEEGGLGGVWLTSPFCVNYLSDNC